MKRIVSLIICIVLVVALLPCSVFAGTGGSGNVDGGGGDMGDGESSNFWNPGQDGVRVTVVRASDNQPVTKPIDLTNNNESNIFLHFGKKSKLHYRNGAQLAPHFETGSYSYVNPSKPLPTIISDSGNQNIAAIKQYFCSEETIKRISQLVGASYETLVNGKYKLLLEPIAYMTFRGRRYAMTATEAALFDQKLSGGLRARMRSISHQNLPLSMFLERADLGYPNYTGSRTQSQSNSTIISSLGLGVVKFRDSPSYSPPIVSSAEYRANTDVITSVTLSTWEEISPTSPASVTFNIGGSSFTVTNIVIPQGESQLCWVKWHTPSTPQTIPISISSTAGTLSCTMINAKITDLQDSTPPNPTANDRNDNYQLPSNTPNGTQATSNSWGVWSADWTSSLQWQENWQWESHSDWQSGGQWVDNGQWVYAGSYQYKFTTYYATLVANMSLRPDDTVPTANGKQMRSGYGVKVDVSTNINTSAPLSSITQAQTAITYFPEYQYKTYWRILDFFNYGNSALLEFKTNKYSTYNRRVHFTPLWFPDSKYTAYTYLEDAWTPAGMLSTNLTDYVNIYGNVYDDWHIGPKLS